MGSTDQTSNAGAQNIEDSDTKMDPCDPILIMTHFVQVPWLINFSPARIGLASPVSSSACNFIFIRNSQIY